MWMVINTGMRRAEVVNLRLCEMIVDPETKEGEVLIRGKYNDERRGFLLGATVEALEKWLAVRSDSTSEAVFISMPPDKKGLHESLLPGCLE
jgi:site-specific recombinase XerC